MSESVMIQRTIPHRELVNHIKTQIPRGYNLGKLTFQIPHRNKIRVDVCFENENKRILWEVELKARYEEKLFYYHLLKENFPNLEIYFNMVVQRSNSKKQLIKIAKKFLSDEEMNFLDVITVNDLAGKKIEELTESIPELYWVHRNADQKCAALFTPCAFEDGFNRGIRLVGIYLKEQGYSISDIEGYIIWLADKLGLPQFETKSTISQIKKEVYPSCSQIREIRTKRGPYILKFGDLRIEEICKKCNYTNKDPVPSIIDDF